MSTFFKVALGLLLTLPLGAYIAGTLVASQADMPDQRPAVVISQATSGTAGPSETARPSARPKPSPTASPDDSDDDSRDDSDDSDDSDDDDVRVVRPTPREVDDDDHRDDDADDSDDGGDDSGDGDDDD